MPKKNRSLMLVIALILCLWLTPALGATVTQEDVEVVLTTDKTSYQQGENISVSVSVTNMSGLPLTDVSIEHKNPVGYVFSKDSEPSKQFDILAPKESLTLKALNIPYQVPMTGDDSRIGVWVSLFIIAGLGLVFLAVRVKRARRLMALLLCLTSLGAYAASGTIALAENQVHYTDWPEKFSPRMRMARSAEPAEAENRTITIHVKEQVTVSGQSLEVMATVMFTLPSLSDNLLDDIIDRGDIETLLSMGLISVLYDDQGNLITIDGPFTKRVVKTSADAADVLNSASSLFGEGFFVDQADVSMQELPDEQYGDEIFYNYIPTKYGLPVLGSQVILNTNGNGNVMGLYSTYNSRVDTLDVYPSIDDEAAIQAAKAAFLKNPEIVALIEQAIAQNTGIDSNEAGNIVLNQLDVESKLVIYAADDALPVATVYAVRFLSKQGFSSATQEDTAAINIPIIDMTFYVYANGENAGTVHSTVDDVLSWFTNGNITAVDALGKSRNIYVSYYDGSHKFVDYTRKITTYRTKFAKIPIYRKPILPGDIAVYNLLDGRLSTYVSAHANMAFVYDYYLKKLGRLSFDGKGAAVKVSTEYIGQGLSWEYYNAFWSPAYKQFAFGNRGNYAAALDVCAHEFTHAVINYVVSGSLTYSGQSGALNESYADILGSIVEGKSGDGRWLLSEDADKTIRDMSDPTDYGQPDHFKNYEHSKGVHSNSGIPNHAAYEMMTDSRTRDITRDTWAKLFYRSLYRLTSDAQFLNARGALVSEARRMRFTDQQMKAIGDAFDHVGIKEPASIRIVLTWGASPADLDAHLVGPAVTGSGNRFHVYYGQKSYGTDGSYADYSDYSYVDLDYDDTTSYGPEVITIRNLTPGTYYYYVHDYSNRATSGSTALAKSQARVQAYLGSSSQPFAMVSVSPSSTGTFWNVFKLELGKKTVMTPIGTYGDSTAYQ